MVGHSPFAQPLAQREIAVAHDAVHTHRDKIGAHVGKIGITAIDKLRVVPLLPQRFRYGRERLRLGGIFHNRGRGLRRIATQNRSEPPVGPETISITVGKENTLRRYLFEPGHHPREAAQTLHGGSRETLEHHQQQVGSGLYPLGRIGREDRGSSAPQRLEKGIGLGIIEKAILRRKVLRLGERRHQAEHRVDGGMIQLHAVTEIGFAHIHGRNRKAAPYGDKQGRREQQQRSQREPGPACFFPLRNPPRPVPQGPHEQQCIDHDEQQNHRRLPDRNTGHGIGRRSQIEERRGIDAESPETVQHGIAQGDGRNNHGYQHKIDAKHGLPPSAPQTGCRGGKQGR